MFIENENIKQNTKQNTDIFIPLQVIALKFLSKSKFDSNNSNRFSGNLWFLNCVIAANKT